MLEMLEKEDAKIDGRKAYVSEFGIHGNQVTCE
jgi:hypothetical protein